MRFFYHLRDAETMPKVMKRYIVVILIRFVQEIPQHVNIYGEFRAEVVIQIHLLK